MLLPKGVQRVRKRLADGREAEYFYFRPTGARLPHPEDPAFSAALEAARRPISTEAPAGTFGALVTAYKRSQGYRNLAPKTAKYYDRALERCRGWESLQVEKISRADVLIMRDALATQYPQAANQLVMVLACIFDFAIDREMREYSPVHKIKRIKGGEWDRWPEPAIQYALQHFPEHFRRAVVLALYTGQREGDCLRMEWSRYDGTGIEVKQQKTGTLLWIPAHKALRKELDAWRIAAKGATILTNSWGRGWRPGAFATQFSNLMAEHVALDGLVFHGLRKAAAARLAEAGCPEREIMAITGHLSSQMVDHYTRQASQKIRALSAIKKLEKYR